MVAGKVRRDRKFDWDRLFDGQEHRLVAGEDFWTSVRNFQSQVSQMARSRGVKVSTRSDVAEARAKQAPKRIVWVKAEP